MELTRPELGGRQLQPQPQVAAFFERRCCAVQYIVSDPGSGACAIIDPVLDYDEKSGSIATGSADALLAVRRRAGFAGGLDPGYAPPRGSSLRRGLSARADRGAQGIGERVIEVQRLWADIYNLPDRSWVGGPCWDRLFGDGDRFTIGEIAAEVLFSPGHTLASVTYVIGNAALFTTPY